MPARLLHSDSCSQQLALGRGAYELVEPGRLQRRREREEGIQQRLGWPGAAAPCGEMRPVSHRVEPGSLERARRAHLQVQLVHLLEERPHSLLAHAAVVQEQQARVAGGGVAGDQEVVELVHHLREGAGSVSTAQGPEHTRRGTRRLASACSRAFRYMDVVSHTRSSTESRAA